MKISICMCTYNGEEYLEEQLDSLVNQSRKPDEIIVYDDCSNDRTVEILAKYALQYAAIHWCIAKNEQNVGWRVNFKKAVEATTGDIIFFCDQDDIWMPNKLEKMSEVLSKDSRIGVLVADYVPFYLEGAAEKNLETGSKNTGIVSMIAPDEKLIYCDRPGCVFAFKSEMKREFLRCWSQEFAHDGLMWRIACLQKKLYHIDYISIQFRRHSSNASSHKYKTISKERALSEKKTNDVYLKCFQNIASSIIVEENERKLLEKIVAYFEARKKYYAEPSIGKFLRMTRFIQCYRKRISFFKDLAILVYKA